MRFLPLFIFMLLAVGMGVALLKPDSATPPSPMIGRMLPELSFALLEKDAPTALRAPIKGKPYLLSVFASWCMPCLAEWPVLFEMKQKYQIPMVGLAWKNAPVDVQVFLAKHGNPFSRIWQDEQGISTVPLGLTGVPETFVIDANGTIILHSKQPITRDYAQQHIIPLFVEAP